MSFNKINIKAAVAECVAMAFFVYLGCGSAALNDPNQRISSISGTGTDEIIDGNGANIARPSWVQLVALQFGLSITVLAYATAHISGGQINCAITFALVLAKELSVVQGIANFAAQMVGSVLGASLLLGVTENDKEVNFGTDFTNSLGANTLNPRFAWGNAFLAELLMTALLTWVVFETAVNKKGVAGNCAPIAIGLAVFVAHVVNIPITGCSINPTRSFGPAVVASLNGADDLWDDHWIFWVAPLMGSALAAIARGIYISKENEKDGNDEEEKVDLVEGDVEEEE
mmetsp:Transcript_20256/g.31289  ORF Transcript_20256/g.31289 Transcript_20256/m.31289 type:complete len:286 (-) Transcript_20256:238-1095(-)